MQYLGGKTTIAGKVAAIVNAERCGRPFWEPFCGGLSVSTKLAAGGPGIVSDAFAPLIALYQAVKGGWIPPETLSEAEYQAARALPDSDPRKAFAGFGCAFGGKWFRGYARGGARRARNYAGYTRRALLRDLPALSRCPIERLDFLAIEPRPLDLVIYADPPYANTTGYKTGAFDHLRFWARAQAWERAGVPVFVSEYACPVPHRIVGEWAKKGAVGAVKEVRTERLFRVMP